MIRRGATLLEATVATAVLAALVAMVYGIVLASERAYGIEVPLRERQLLLQRITKEVAREVRESSAPLLRTELFSEPGFSGDQSLLAFPSARDEEGIFRSEGAVAQWTKLLVYAPYLDPVTGERQLRRYEVPGPPASFFTPGASATIGITPVEILLDGLPVARGGGSRIAGGCTRFLAEAAGGGLTFSLELEGNRRLQQKTRMIAGAWGRN